MKYGYVYPGGEARQAAECARAAEQSGWDGFFVWDPVWGVDPWVSLAAAAVLTERIRLGTMISPLSRQRPWTVAGATATLDRLSGGRLILSVGLGAPETGFARFGEETDRKIRAELLDESLEIITRLWSGQPFDYSGKHYRVSGEISFLPPLPPIQTPRIPIWVVGGWPREKSMRRVLRFDGLLPNKLNVQGGQEKIQPEDIRQMKAYIEERRGTDAPFDIVMEGETPGAEPQKAADIVRPWAEAGATWWLDASWGETDHMWEPAAQERILARIRLGPPRVE